MDLPNETLCARCGETLGQHHCESAACPAGPFPKWPSSIKDEAKAGALWDKRIKAFWAKSKTTFKAVV